MFVTFYMKDYAILVSQGVYQNFKLNHAIDQSSLSWFEILNYIVTYYAFNHFLMETISALLVVTFLFRKINIFYQ